MFDGLTYFMRGFWLCLGLNCNLRHLAELIKLGVRLSQALLCDVFTSLELGLDFLHALLKGFLTGSRTLKEALKL